jgi:hypothetical protein
MRAWGWVEQVSRDKVCVFFSDLLSVVFVPLFFTGSVPYRSEMYRILFCNQLQNSLTLYIYIYNSYINTAPPEGDSSDDGEGDSSDDGEAGGHLTKSGKVYI